VRAKHPVRLEPEQPPLWDDFHTMPRDHAHLSFQQRRQQIVGDCRQLKTDQDSYNDLHPNHETINLVFDFTMDLAELESAAD
jgi:hypothetical protein